MVVTEPASAIRRVLRLVLPALVVLFAAAVPAAALESSPVSSARDTATLVSDTDAVAPGTPFRMALRLRMQPGWHTYWQNPGDAGVAPEMKLNLPPGATAGPIDWPTPQRIAEGSLMTYAYTGEVLLPITVTPGNAAGPVEATATGWSARKSASLNRAGSNSTCRRGSRRPRSRRRCSRVPIRRGRSPPRGRRLSRRMAGCGSAAPN